MVNKFAHLTTSNIFSLTPYQPGKPIEELQRELGINNIVKLASNESPLDVSSIVATALQKNIELIKRYPDGSAHYLKQALAKNLSLPTTAFTIGHGSSEIFELLIRIFASSKLDEIVVSQYAFIVYNLIAQAVGTKVVTVKADNWGHDLEAIYNAINTNTKLVFIANPNNPTGTFIPIEKIENFLSKINSNVLVVLDEAYIEYVDTINSTSLLDQYHNLVITRTFSKIYALAALRIGYSMSHVDIADLLNRVRAPFNTNHLAHIGAVAALSDKEFIENSIAVNESGRQQIIAGLEQLNLEYIPTAANFISFKVPIIAQIVYQKLLEQGVIIRPLASYNMPNWLRVSIGLEQENDIFLDKLAHVLDPLLQ